jgi:hypothetical protein
MICTDGHKSLLLLLRIFYASLLILHEQFHFKDILENAQIVWTEIPGYSSKYLGV